MKIDCLEFIDNVRNNVDLSTRKTLAIIQIGDDKVSNLYVKSKKQEGEKWNIQVDVYKAEEDTTEDTIKVLIEYLNETADGIIIQLPLPKHLNINALVPYIDPMKNVDGFNHPFGVVHSPCTPLGIISLIKHLTDVKGKTVTVIGRGNLVGKPLINYFQHEPCTLICCNSNTPYDKLIELIKNSDIVISAIGKPEYIKLPKLSKHLYFIDAGTSYVDGKQVGDLSHDDLSPLVDYTPWVNGVGKLTVTALMCNVRGK